MTSRADPTILERILDGREPLLDLMNEYRAAIEQEVRDDIRARVERLRVHETGDARHARERAWNRALDRVLMEVAAISSSSATENRHESATPVVTQDGERPDR